MHDVYVIIYSNPNFYRQFAGYGMGVGHNTVSH